MKPSNVSESFSPDLIVGSTVEVSNRDRDQPRCSRVHCCHDQHRNSRVACMLVFPRILPTTFDFLPAQACATRRRRIARNCRLIFLASLNSVDPLDEHSVVGWSSGSKSFAHSLSHANNHRRHHSSSGLNSIVLDGAG